MSEWGLGSMGVDFDIFYRYVANIPDRRIWQKSMVINISKFSGDR